MRPIPERILPWFATALLLGALSPLPSRAQSGSESSSADGTVSILYSPGVGGGGRAQDASGSIAADTATGDTFSGEILSHPASGIRLGSNHVAQLYDEAVSSPADLRVTAEPGTIDEGGGRQLVVETRMDDGTFVALEHGVATWAVIGGPLLGVDVDGFATAGLVFQPATATVRGSYLGFDDDYDLTVLDSEPDNFGPVAGDEIDDSWQFGFFDGDSNGVLDAAEAALAAPGANPDGDADDNLFEFNAGFSPVDRLDSLDVQITRVAPTIDRIRINKLIPGRTYTLMRSTDLENFVPVETIIPTTEEIDLVIDKAASPERSFYTIEISKP